MSDASLLSDHVREEIDRWVARFPEDRSRSAVIGALHAVQHENEGYLTAELMNGVADYLNLPTIQVYEVATFYSMFQTKPVGRHNVAICTNVSCMLRGADDLVEHVENKLGIKTWREHRRRAHLPQERRGVPGGLLWRTDDDGRPQVSRAPDDLKRSRKSWTGSTE